MKSKYSEVSNTINNARLQKILISGKAHEGIAIAAENVLKIFEEDLINTARWQIPSLPGFTYVYFYQKISN